MGMEGCLVQLLPELSEDFGSGGLVNYLIAVLIVKQPGQWKSYTKAVRRRILHEIAQCFKQQAPTFDWKCRLT